MKRIALAAVAALSFVAPHAANAATQINITNYSFAVGSNSGVLHFAGSPFDGAGVSIGEFKLTGTEVGSGTAATFYTYCVDIMHALSVPGVFDIKPLSQMYTGVTATNVNKILANTNATNATEAAAIQLALWEVTFETSGSFNVNSGAFNITGGDSGAARTLANTYLSNLGTWNVSSTQTAQLLYNPNLQSQVYLAPVPEPTTWAMMIVGFGAVGATMRIRRRAGAMVAA
ncbi:MAG: PEPxxWA-CTERM sorting domain-containing protein [Pseudomonadota bacterium]